MTVRQTLKLLKAKHHPSTKLWVVGRSGANCYAATMDTLGNHDPNKEKGTIMDIPVASVHVNVDGIQIVADL